MPPDDERRPTVDQVVAVGLLLAFLAAVLSHHGLLAVAFAVLAAGLWLARRP